MLTLTHVDSSVLLDGARIGAGNVAQRALADGSAVQLQAYYDKTPVLLINGERDPYANAAGLPAFFSRLTGVDRRWVVLANADHAAHLERQAAFVNAVVSFMER